MAAAPATAAEATRKEGLCSPWREGGKRETRDRIEASEARWKAEGCEREREGKKERREAREQWSLSTRIAGFSSGRLEANNEAYSKMVL